MWLWRFAALSLATAFQVVLVVDALDTLADGGVVHWAAALAPSIIFLALIALFVIFGFVGALCACAGSRERTVRGDGQQYQSLADLPLESDELESEGPSLACIYAGDALIDLLLLVPASVFLGLLIAQLDSAGTLYAWAGVFAPAWVLLVLLMVVFGASAVRTRAERADADARADKPRNQAALAEFQAVPCAFLCVPSMSYGALDVFVAWLLFLLPLALAISLILLAVRLTEADGTPTLQAVFAPLWVVLGPLGLLSLALYASLLLNYKSALKLPLGRVNIVAKHGEVLATIVFSILATVQLVLIAQRVENAPADDRDWFVILLPTIIGSVLGIFCSCCAIKGCTLEARIERQRARNAQSGTNIAYTTAGNSRAHSSHYGLLPSNSTR